MPVSGGDPLTIVSIVASSLDDGPRVSARAQQHPERG